MNCVFKYAALCCCVFALYGCLNSYNVSKGISSGAKLYQAATLSDAEISNMSKQMRQAEDARANVASANSSYAKRLNKITEKLRDVNGVPLNYKVYMTNQINANATPDGSVRVYSGLMDKMNDDELRFVIGHEIGHVALGHSKKAMQVAYAASAARDAAGAVNPAAGVIASSQLGALSEEFLNSQFSQSQESDADAYSMKFLKDNGYNTRAAGDALSKLATPGSSGGVVNALFSTHPDPLKRAEKMYRLAGNGQ